MSVAYKGKNLPSARKHERRWRKGKDNRRYCLLCWFYNHNDNHCYNTCLGDH